MLEKDFFEDHGHGDNYQSTNELWISEEESPPEYLDKQGFQYSNFKLILALKLHVKLSVNLRDLPSDAWERHRGVRGEYHRVRYTLGLVFGAGGIEWRFLHKGTIIGSVDCEYL